MLQFLIQISFAELKVLKQVQDDGMAITILEKLFFDFPSKIFPHQILNIYFILSQTKNIKIIDFLA